MNTDVVICSQPEFLDRNFEWITGVVFTASYWDRNLEKKEIPEKKTMFLRLNLIYIFGNRNFI